MPIEFLSASPPPEWKSTRHNLANYPERNRVFSVSNPQRRFNWPDAIREVTSANSATPYRDDLFGQDFATSLFISEPANNVVHREVLAPDGVMFKSHRAEDEQDREFLASSDNWFRPTMLKTGPDGALYICDMYRLVIEHPEYFPEELKNRPDLRAGDDKGRIWRVYPDETPRTIPRLDRLDLKELVSHLDSPNGWQRDTVQRLLTHALAPRTGRNGSPQQKLSAPMLKELRTLATRNPRSKTRLQALSTLHTIGAAQASDMVAGLKDEDAAIRAEAIRLAIKVSQANPREVSGRNLTNVEAALLNCVSDPDAGAQFQLALSFKDRVLLG